MKTTALPMTPADGCTIATLGGQVLLLALTASGIVAAPGATSQPTWRLSSRSWSGG